MVRELASKLSLAFDILSILVFVFPYITSIAVGIGPSNVHLNTLFKQGQGVDEAILALRKSFLGGFIPQTNGQPYELGKKAKKKYSLFPSSMWSTLFVNCL